MNGEYSFRLMFKIHWNLMKLTKSNIKNVRS